MRSLSHTQPRSGAVTSASQPSSPSSKAESPNPEHSQAKDRPEQKSSDPTRDCLSILSLFKFIFLYLFR